MSGKKLGNSGMSLIELLVALAASSLVVTAAMMLLVQGTDSYRKQTTGAQLQEDANISLNHITDSIMEATMVEVSNSESVNGNTQEFFVNADTKYRYDETSGILYITKKDSSSGSYIDSVLCTNVKKFRVQVISTSVKTEKQAGGKYKVVGINNPVQLKVTIEVEYNKITRNVSRVTALRNEVDSIKLHFFDAEEFPDVEVLKSYGFLVDE